MQSIQYVAYRILFSWLQALTRIGRQSYRRNYNTLRITGLCCIVIFWSWLLTKKLQREKLLLNSYILIVLSENAPMPRLI